MIAFFAINEIFSDRFLWSLEGDRSEMIAYKIYISFVVLGKEGGNTQKTDCWKKIHHYKALKNIREKKYKLSNIPVKGS